MEISVGAILEGNIKSITKFGAFVSLPGGRSGLCHISEIAHSYVADVKDHLTEGQEVKVKVVGIDEAGRINLSIKKATPPPARPQNQQRQGGFDRERQGGRTDFRGGNRSFNNNNNGERPQRSGGYQNSGERREGGYQGGGNGGGFRRDPRPTQAQQSAGPADFEARLKQFMQQSDSKLSDLRMTEKRSSRRSGHR